jgi:hypothetical protein
VLPTADQTAATVVQPVGLVLDTDSSQSNPQRLETHLVATHLADQLVVVEQAEVQPLYPEA